jgi:hypothetical protein
VGGWRQWQPRLAFVARAMAFFLGKRLDHASERSLLTCRDVMRFLKQAFRGCQMTAEDVFRQMERRHCRRQQAIECAYGPTHCAEACSFAP